MGLFGGSSSKKYTTTNQSREDNVATNYAGENINIGHAGGSVTVQSLDGDVATAAISGIRDAAAEAMGFTGDALTNMRLTAQDAVNATASTSNAALELGYRFGSDSLGYFSDVVRDAVNAVEWQSQQSTQQIERSLASVDSANTSDSAETMQQLVKWAALAVAAVAAISVWRK